MAIERGTNHFDEIDENPWRDCGKMERAAQIITPINLDELSFNLSYRELPGKSDDPNEVYHLVDVLGLSTEAQGELKKLESLDFNIFKLKAYTKENELMVVSTVIL